MILRSAPTPPAVCEPALGSLYGGGQEIEVVGRGFAGGADVNVAVSVMSESAVQSFPLATAVADSDGVLNTVVLLDFESNSETLGRLTATGTGVNGQPRVLSELVGLLPEVTQDTDGDGVLDACDNCRLLFGTDQSDTDGDGLGDICDPFPTDPRNDLDGDGLAEDEDSCPADPENDADGDGVCELVDNCPAVG